MSKKQAKLGDKGIGICTSHSSPISMTGYLITGSTTANVNGKPAARVGDIVLGDCGHEGVMIEGSKSVFIDGKKACGIGDAFAGCFTGTLVGGSYNTNIGG